MGRHIELGRKTEYGIHATESPEEIFGRLIASELITISLFEAIPNNEDLGHVRSELMSLWQNAEKVFSDQIGNYPNSNIAARVSSDKHLATNSFRDTINEAINFLDDIQ